MTAGCASASEIPECGAESGDFWLAVAVRERLRRLPGEPGSVSEVLVAGEDVRTRGAGGCFLLLSDAALERCMDEKPCALAVSTELAGDAVNVGVSSGLCSLVSALSC